MDTRVAVTCVAVLILPLSLYAAEEATVAVSPYVGIDIGLARIECVSAAGVGRASRRGALIDTGATVTTYEVVLTAAHGLPRETEAVIRTCFLIGYAGRQYPIEAIWHPEQRGRGFTDDWAVILVVGRLSGHVARLRIAPLAHPELQQMISNDAPVRLPLRFAPSERECELTQSRLTVVEVRDGLLAHNCQAWSGHSGSPILINLEGQRYVLGIHLGSRWIFERNAPLRLGRYVDAKISAAIEAAAERGRLAATR